MVYPVGSWLCPLGKKCDLVITRSIVSASRSNHRRSPQCSECRRLIMPIGTATGRMGTSTWAPMTGRDRAVITSSGVRFVSGVALSTRPGLWPGRRLASHQLINTVCAALERQRLSPSFSLQCTRRVGWWLAQRGRSPPTSVHECCVLAESSSSSGDRRCVRSRL